MAEEEFNAVNVLSRHYCDEFAGLTGAGEVIMQEMMQRATKIAAYYSFHPYQIVSVFSVIAKNLGGFEIIRSENQRECTERIALAAARITASVQNHVSVEAVRTHWLRSERATQVLSAAASEMIVRALKSSIYIPYTFENLVQLSAVIDMMAESHLTLEADILSKVGATNKHLSEFSPFIQIKKGV